MLFSLAHGNHYEHWLLYSNSARVFLPGFSHLCPCLKDGVQMNEEPGEKDKWYHLNVEFKQCYLVKTEYNDIHQGMADGRAGKMFILGDNLTRSSK